MELFDLKEGDEVYVSGRLREVGSIAKVERVTKNFIIVKGNKFRKCNGYKTGDYDTYSRSSIEPLTEELRIKVRHNALFVYLNSFGFQDLPLNTLEDIYKKVRETHKKITSGADERK